MSRTDSSAGQGVLMAEWLGRGGIAHTAHAWAVELERRGRTTLTVTRADRELAADLKSSIGIASPLGPVGAHVAAVRALRRLLATREYSHVVLHGSVIPQLELTVLSAARRHGVASVLVAHEPSLARRSIGGAAALGQLVRGADVVVAHSRFVASALEQTSRRTDFELLPLPLQLGLVDTSGSPIRPGTSVLPTGGAPIALQFGHLHRGYKGAAIVSQLANPGIEGWRIALVGKGAPEGVMGVESVGRFLEAGDLAATVASSAVSLFPYARASQSGAVVLAQALGSVPLATAVGGLPEQIADGSTGLLLPADAPAARWRQAIEQLSDPASRAEMAEGGRRHVVEEHARFSGMIDELVS